MHPEYSRLAGLQGAIVIIGAAITYFVVTPPAAKSFAYGSCVALAGVLFLAWRLRRAEGSREQGAEFSLRQAYRTAIERFVWIIFLLASGFKLLNLAPLWMLAGFVAGQSAWIVVPVWIRLRMQNDK